MIIHADKDSPRANGEGWHTDVSCDPEPPMGSILYIKQCPPKGGDTLFASMYAAYEALSDRMKTYLEGMTALHDGEPVYRGLYANYGIADKPAYPRAEHPVVRTHPVTGKKGLYVNRGFTRGLVGVPRAPLEIPGLFSIDMADLTRYYYFVLVLVALGIFAIWRVVRSPLGLTLQGMLDGLRTDRLGASGADIEFMARIRGVAGAVRTRQAMRLPGALARAGWAVTKRAPPSPAPFSTDRTAPVMMACRRATGSGSSRTASSTCAQNSAMIVSSTATSRRSLLPNSR